MTAAELVEHLRLCSRSAIVDVTPRQAGEWADVIEREVRANIWGDFIGPCAHGRDPYTRCDVCGDLRPVEAAVRAEREACALVAEFFDSHVDPAPAITKAIRARGGQ